MEMTEHQGWALADIDIQSSTVVRVDIHCQGIHTVFVDGRMLAADLYNRRVEHSSISLSPGMHTVHVHVRAKAQGQFSCTAKLVPDNAALLLTPPLFKPDLLNGKCGNS
jgi:hypothetical protein